MRWLGELEPVVRLRQGDRTALNDLCLRYADPAIRIAFSVTGSRALAEDAVQEAFIQVLRKIASLRNPDSFPTWFYRIVVNAAKRLTRNTNRSLPFELITQDHPDPAAIIPDEAALEAEEVRLLWAAITELDEPHRLPIVLRYYIKLSEHEIAGALGIPPGTVKSRLHTARRLLHARLGGTGGAIEVKPIDNPPGLASGGERGVLR